VVRRAALDGYVSTQPSAPVCKGVAREAIESCLGDKGVEEEESSKNDGQALLHKGQWHFSLSLGLCQVEGAAVLIIFVGTHLHGCGGSSLLLLAG
jgi:hypothetical protein